MRTTIVCGMLGSGKTTFIKNSVQHAKEKTVVLVNDFGSAGIDGEIFSAGNIESIELPSGCICCTLRFDLISTIKRVVSYFSPEHLVIEPSGVASPLRVLESLESSMVTAYTVVGLVDVTEFMELYDSGMFGNFFEEQITNSDVILVNKIDLVDEKRICTTLRRIGALNPRAILFKTKNADISAQFLANIDPRSKRTGPEPHAHMFFLNKQYSHCEFESLSFRLRNGVCKQVFMTFFEDLVKGRFGTVARAKALVETNEGPYRFDGVFGKIGQIRFERQVVDSRLVIIGKWLNKAGIERILKGC